jgi:hypothetical protein
MTVWCGNGRKWGGEVKADERFRGRAELEHGIDGNRGVVTCLWRQRNTAAVSDRGWGPRCQRGRVI